MSSPFCATKVQNQGHKWCEMDTSDWVNLLMVTSSLCLDGQGLFVIGKKYKWWLHHSMCKVKNSSGEN
jgi:hypothetical protein